MKVNLSLRWVMLQQDPRDYQILFLSLFLILGIGTRDWTLRPDLIVVVMVTCLLTQWVALSIWSNLASSPKALSYQIRLYNPFYLFISSCSLLCELCASVVRLKKGVVNPDLVSLKSAMITGLGLSLLLRADHYTTMMLAGALAILSKFLFQVERKHFFNPANFGIIAALIFTGDAWVSPGQWGDDGWYALLFAGTGGLVLKRVGRWDTTVAFLGFYALLEAIRNIWLGWTWDVYFHRLMSGSLLLFALFMITDPRSIPNARISRLLWAGSIAVVTFILRNQFFISTAVFWALFALSPLSVFLDYIWSAPRFSWVSGCSNVDRCSVENKAADTESEQYSQV